jgi:hypothetical protein
MRQSMLLLQLATLRPRSEPLDEYISRVLILGKTWKRPSACMIQSFRAHFLHDFVHVFALMHGCFGHLGYSSLSKMSRSNTVTSLPPPSAFSKELHSSKHCGACAESSQTKVSFPRTVNYSSSSDDPFTATKPLEKLRVDISGPRSQSVGVHHWFTAIVDDVKGFKIVITHRSKSEAADKLSRLFAG